MATDRGLTLTAEEALLERVMWEIVDRVQDTTLILKGGAALVRAYGLNRHSTDLDFDAVQPTDISRRVRRAAEAAGVEIDKRSLWLSPHTGRKGVSRRFKIRFVGVDGKRQKLQIDTRYWPKPRSEETVRRNGIRTYRPEAIYRQKLEALGARREARDLFDLAFITRSYGNSLSDGQIRTAETITRDMNGLEKKLTYQLRGDLSLTRITTATDMVCEFREAVEEQILRRGLLIQQQCVPISYDMTTAILELRETLHGPEANKPRPRPPSVLRTEDRARNRHHERGIDRNRWFSR